MEHTTIKERKAIPYSDTVTLYDDMMNTLADAFNDTCNARDDVYDTILELEDVICDKSRFEQQGLPGLDDKQAEKWYDEYEALWDQKNHCYRIYDDYKDACEHMWKALKALELAYQEYTAD